MFYKHDIYYGKKMEQGLISNISMDLSKTKTANALLIVCRGLSLISHKIAENLGKQILVDRII